jgi:4-azaleucine resistance transporter AzlC
MIYGALALQAGIPVLPAQLMSSIVFAGSSQFITTQLVTTRAPALVIVLTIAVVNLRHALYSASVAPYLQPLSRTWKLALSYLLTDEAYAIAITEYQQAGDSPGMRWYFLGAGLALWTTWQLSTAAGILLGAVIPEGWSLEFTLPLTFIALLISALKDRATTAAALAAGVIAVLLFQLPYKLGLIAAAGVGIITGLWLEGREWKSG